MNLDDQLFLERRVVILWLRFLPASIEIVHTFKGHEISIIQCHSSKVLGQYSTWYNGTISKSSEAHNHWFHGNSFKRFLYCFPVF